MGLRDGDEIIDGDFMSGKGGERLSISLAGALVAVVVVEEDAAAGNTIFAPCWNTAD